MTTKKKQGRLFDDSRHPGTGLRPNRPHRHQAIDTRNAAYKEVMREEQGDILNPEALTEDLGERQATVYEALLEQGPRGATNAELAELLDWPVNRVTPRVYELRGCGKDNPLEDDPHVAPLREDGTRVKRAGPTGTKGQVWVAVAVLSDSGRSPASPKNEDPTDTGAVRVYTPTPRTPARSYWTRIDL